MRVPKPRPLTRATQALACALTLGTGWLAAPTSQAQPVAAAQRHELLLVDLVINGRRLPEIVRAELRADQSLLLELDAWNRADLAPLPSRQLMSDGTPAYALTEIAGLQYHLDRSTLRLEVNAPAAAFTRAALDAGRQPMATAPPPAPGVMLNYDLSLQGTLDRGPPSHAALLEAVAFGAWGHAVTQTLLQDDGVTRSQHRLNTYWRYDMPQRMESLVLGDTVGTSGGWSRPVRYAGLRWGTDFGLRPGFVTQPTLSLAGEAALPSTVDVLVNNQRRLSAPVQPGPFDLRNLPTLSGAGEVNLVVRDLLGRETVITQSFYASPRLLAAGLTDFSLEAGALRRGFGQNSHYGDPFAALSWRRGLSGSLTLEARTELQVQRRAVGVDVATLLDTWALARGSLAVSQRDAQGGSARGHLLQLGLERSASRGGFSLQYLRTSRDFAPFGEAPDPLAVGDRVRTQWFAGVSGRLPGGVFGGLSYARQTRWGGDTLATVGLSASVPLSPRTWLSLSVNRQLAGERGWSAGLYLNVVLGDQTFASGSVEQRTGQATRVATAVARNAPAGPGLGWRVEASSDSYASARAGLQLNAERAEAQLDLASDSHGQVSARAGLRGTLGWLGGRPFASRPVGNSALVLVDAGGLAGVPVLRSNQRVATTDAKGRAVVPGLMPWLANRIELDGTELPMDVEAGELVKEVVPHARSGAIVRFDLRRSRQALVVLLQADGREVPAGAHVTTLPQQTTFVVGLRGEAWLTDLLEKDQHVRVEWTGGGCEIELPALNPNEVAPTLGPLSCKEGIL